MLGNALLVGAVLGAGCVSSLARAAPPYAEGAGAVLGGSSSAKDKGRKLTGRFLHITDFHPDPFYKTYASTAEDSACHRHHGPAGIYGAETSGCDSPFALVNKTFDWIRDNIKDDIDFVVWTGDSSRHDNDEELPRTQKQVLQQNKFMVDKFAEVFAYDDDKDGRVDQWRIPVVPTFGNNDIMPHNIFLAGPNRWTTKYLELWRHLIPEAQRHQFQQGGWFSVEVVPGRLAVFSLNTMYFFSSNSGVDGCANKHEPGFEHMEWLRIQLQILRERNMKAILMGHVPPARVNSKESWDETCWQKYALWQRQFRDVIVGSLYGHMNIDHFMLQDFEQISKDAEKGRMAAGMEMDARQEEEIGLYEDGEVTVASASDYLLDLKESWAQLPAPPAKSNKNKAKGTDFNEDKDSGFFNWLSSTLFRTSRTVGKGEKKKYLDKIGGKFAQRYSVSHVAPSVVPNYYPTLRIIEYNITGMEDLIIYPDMAWTSSKANTHRQTAFLDDSSDVLNDDESYLAQVTTFLKKKKHNKKGPRKYKFKVPEGPSPTSPPGPAYSPQTLTWTRFVQYYANLTRINNDFVENDDPDTNSTARSSTPNAHAPTTIFGLEVSSAGEFESTRWKEGKHHKHQGKQPRHEPHPKEFYFEVEYDTRKDKGFKDLTVRRWVEFARRIGHPRASAAGVDVADEEQTFAQDDVDDDDVAVDQGKKHKKKKKGKKGKHHKASKEWFRFVKRAFVGTMDPHEIKQVFGGSTDAKEQAVLDAEVMEL